MSSDSLDKSTPIDAKSSVTIFALFRFATKLELSLNAIGLVAAIAAGSATPFMSLFFGNIISSFVEIGQAGSDLQRDMDELASIVQEFRRIARQDAIHLVYLGLGTLFSTFLCVSIWAYSGERMARRIRERYFEAVVHQDMSFYDDTTAGEVATRIEIDAHLVQQGISEKFALVASYSSSFATGLAIAYSRSWRLALALSAMLPCILLVGALITILSARYSKTSLVHLSKAGGVAQESISTIRTVQAFASESTLSAVYDSFVRQSHTIDVKISRILGVGMAAFSFIVYSSYSLSFYYGTTLLLHGRANAGTVVTVGLSVLIGSFSLAVVGPNIEAVMHAREAAARLYSVIDRTPLIDSRSMIGHRPIPVHGEITFLDVSFRYPSRSDVTVLEHLNLTFSAGKTSALVGFSGSGKSTIVSLIERFYDPTAGTVLLDGIELPKLNTKWLRSQIGLVSQEPVLFSGTIRDNVALGLLGTPYEGIVVQTTSDRIIQACVKALAHDFIVALPNGYETFVGDGGMRLSGGQKQRIAIARAIVSDPKILLLDEATSALDTQSEGIVQAALTQASEGRTTIVIAHRLSTVKDADVIYVLSNGKVIERGTHDELIQAYNGTYAHLVHTQHLKHEGSEDTDMRSENGDDVMVATTNEDTYLKFFPKRESVPATITGISLLREMGLFIPDTIRLYAWGTLFGCLGGLVYPAFGIVYAQAVHGFEASDLHAIRTAGTRSALWLFLIAVGSTLSLAIHNVLFGKAAAILATRLRSASFRALLNKEVAFFDVDENNPGTLTANLIGGPEKIKGFAAMTLGAILQCTSCCIGGAIIGLIFGWKLSLVGIACMPPIVAMGFIRLQLVAAKEKSNKLAHNESAQIASEAVVAIKTVAALTCEDHSCSLYGTALRRSPKYSIISTTLSNFAFAMSLSVILFAVALMFWYGSTLVASGEYSTFRFYVCFMSTTFACWNASNVFMSVPDFSSAVDAAREVITLMKSHTHNPEHDDSSSEKKTHIQGEVRFKDVSFRYPSRPEIQVLQHFNISITPGSYIAFVGPSGSGKSTIIQLIERFYEPSSGQIHLDGKPLSQIDVQKYRRNVSLVSQDSRLYSGTIRFNILLGSTKAPEEVSDVEIEHACRLARILDFIKCLPMGFETQVGEKGSQLSGGQKQRIAIARAVIRDPKLLLLDEATSALDANSEAAVQEALNNAVVGRTTIAIAHRLSTIQHADCIYVIDAGTIIEHGTHSQLLARRGAYYRLAQLQELRD